MTTAIPEITVDYAVPTATVAGGTPSVEAAFPGLTGPAGSRTREILFGTKGPIGTPGDGSIGWYPRHSGTITRVTASVSDQASGTTTIDVNISGVTIYTDQSQRPVLASTGRHFDDGGTIANATFTDTDYLTVDRDTIGTSVIDLVVAVEYEPDA